LSNAYLTKIERIEIDSKLQEIGLFLFQIFSETAFTVLVMRSRRVKARSVVLFYILIQKFEKQQNRYMLNNFPNTAQPAQLVLTCPSRLGVNLPHRAIFVSIEIIS
jgi:hypothetical protein